MITNLPDLKCLLDDSPANAEAKLHLNNIFRALEFFTVENIAVTIKPTVKKNRIKYAFALRNVAIPPAVVPQPSAKETA